MNDAGPLERGSIARRAPRRLSARCLVGHECNHGVPVRTTSTLPALSTRAYSDGDTAGCYPGGDGVRVVDTSRPPWLLVDVAVGDRDIEVVVVAVARGQVLGDRHRAVAPAGTADRDHQMGLALGDVLREQEVE